MLLDPAILVPPHVALWAAENARAERRYASFEEAIDRRYEESQLHGRRARSSRRSSAATSSRTTDGWRYRYTQAAVVAATGRWRRPAPGFAETRVPTLLVLGDDSYLPYDLHVEAHRAALGDLLEVVTVPGGHTVLWDALDETTAAVVAFVRG